MDKEKKAVVKKDPKVKTEKTKASPSVDSKEPAPVKPRETLKVPASSVYGTGKRKSSIAKVWLFPGTGIVEINGMSASEYLPTPIEVKQVLRPLETLNLVGKYDLRITVLGGGLMGQAGAAQHGVARALLEVNPEFRKTLKDEGFLTRDPRVKERKKYGRKRARKGFQFRKR
ncbi:30S ribosomal protein S9 [bacterium]|nr:30S ribosomal protein S9 [bacterium]